MLSKLNSLREKNEDGFTLIELLIVVVIIGILAAIAIPIFLNQQKAAIAGTVKSDVRNTVTNVATLLTTNNNATDVSGATKVVTTGNTIVVYGGWTDYIVVGTNSNLTAPLSLAAPATAATALKAATATGSFYWFNSATGAYKGSGDIA